MSLASAPRESSGQNERPSMAVQAAPAPAGVSLLVSRFLPTRELSNNFIILHRTTSAKTRATATLRQRHIPPNVSQHYKTNQKICLREKVKSQKKNTGAQNAESYILNFLCNREAKMQ